MRSIIVVALVSTLALAPAAQAQQVVMPAVPSPAGLVQASPQWGQTESAGIRAVTIDSEQKTATAAAVREPSARNALAILGALVLVIAVISLVR